MSTKKAPEGAQVQEEYTSYRLESQIKERIKSATSVRPVRRKELVRLTKTDDRTVRLAIAVLRNNGERIVAAEKGGYYYAETEGQYRQWRKSIEARIINLNKMLKAMDRTTEGQVEFDVFRENG